MLIFLSELLLSLAQCGGDWERSGCGKEVGTGFCQTRLTGSEIKAVTRI